jgi:hypothetical protein
VTAAHTGLHVHPSQILLDPFDQFAADRIDRLLRFATALA